MLFCVLFQFERQMENNPKVNRRIKYNSYTEEDRTTVGKYAHDHSTAAALKKFGPKYNRLTESTVRTWRDKFRESLNDGPQVGFSWICYIFGVYDLHVLFIVWL